MKHAILLAIVAACAPCASCAPPPSVSVLEQPPWVVDAVRGAAAFWAAHDETIEVVDDIHESDIHVELLAMTDARDLGHYSGGVLQLAPRLEAHTPLDQKCVVAHELGHRLGMLHVESGEHLMAPTLSVDVAGDDCWWTPEDETELGLARRSR